VGARSRPRAAHDDLLRLDVQVVQELRCGLRGEEGDERERGIVRNAGERVAGDDAGEPGARAHDHLDVEAEPGRELALEPCPETVG
jgi:hypothetical protein